MREKERGKEGVCTCTGEEERRKGKLGGQESDFFCFFCLVFYFFNLFFGSIHLLSLVSQRGERPRGVPKAKIPPCVFFLVRREEGRGVNKSRRSDGHDGSCRYEADANNHKG